jgi:uncharacterized membrane protein HdeD (DUF308 family)
MTHAAEARSNSPWWVFLLTGILWIVFAFIVLSFNMTTVYAVAIFFGVMLLVGGTFDLMLASMERDWRWWHILIGILEIIVGIMALAWPNQTFLVLAALIGWFVMLSGVIDAVVAITTRRLNDLWWLLLIIGALQIAIGVWAIGYTDRSIALLVFWVGITALVRGFSQLAFAFGLRQIDKDLEQVMTV